MVKVVEKGDEVCLKRQMGSNRTFEAYLQLAGYTTVGKISYQA